MTLLEMTMWITDEHLGWFNLQIEHEACRCLIKYAPALKSIQFPDKTSDLCLFLLKHRYQLQKLLRNKRPDTYYVGFHLNFILWKDKDVSAFNAPDKLIVVDRRDKGYKCYVRPKTDTEAIDELFIDGCYLETSGVGGYALLHKDISGQYSLFRDATEERGSSRIELLAAIEGLKRFSHLGRLRMVTDSQYVRKGLSEWLICWMQNGFMTANGEKARNIDLWQEADQLTQGRYIELEWVKAHRDHFENTLCDLYARESAMESKDTHKELQ